jgi:HSP20 family molecular chaperone IbpA
MFNKKRCNACGEKISGNYNFCPYCRVNLAENDDEEWGMLGKNDFAQPDEMKMPFGFNALFNTLLKNLDKQFNELERNYPSEKNKKPHIRKSGVSISINTSNGRPPEIKIKRFGDTPQIQGKKNGEKSVKKQILKSFSEKQRKKFSHLPRKDPDTEIRRLSDRIVYEIKMPGVISLENVSINQLEESIEIKAIGKKNSYSKIIPVKLPVRKYNISKGKLVLELDSRE